MSTAPSGIVVLQDAAWIGYVHDSLNEVFGMMLGMTVTPCEGKVTSEITSVVGLTGSLNGLFTISCSQATGAKLAEAMLGTPECGDHVLDALGEICNMLAGSFKSRIPSIGDTCMLSVPTTIAGTDYQVHTVKDGQRFATVVKFDEHFLQVILRVNC
jgi:chemotaxis protein CheX